MRGGWQERGSVAIRLGRAHFAFYRGYLDGLDLGLLARQYLMPTSGLTASTVTAPAPPASTGDLRMARATLRWIQAELRQAARRALKPADARLLAVAPRVLRDTRCQLLPSLEDFRLEHDPDGLYGEAELLELFAQAHPAAGVQSARHAARARRLRQRQQRALAQLELEIDADPQAADPIDAWLDARIAARLAAVGVITLGALQKLIDRHGYHWYRKVPRVGVQAALHVASWLQQESVCAALGWGPAPHAVIRPRTLRRPRAERVASDASDISVLLAQVHRAQTRLQLFVEEMEYDGGGAMIVEKDAAALATWLTQLTAGGHALRAYRRESERFLMWILLERRKSFATADAVDFEHYRLFLTLLGRCAAVRWQVLFRLPQDFWLGERGVRRDSVYWRPFHGALQNASQRQALIIIQGLLRWLFDTQYLATDLVTRAKADLSSRPIAGPCDEVIDALSAAAGMPVPSSADPILMTPPATLRETKVLARDDLQLHAMARGYCGAQRIVQSRAQPAEKVAPSARVARLRLRVVFSLALLAGLRLSQISSLRRRQMVAIHGEDAADAAWALVVLDRHGDARAIRLSTGLVDLIDEYHAALAPAPADREAALPLVSSLDDVAKTISAQRLYVLLKQAFNDGAERASASGEEAAARLRRCSPDWLRRLRLPVRATETSGHSLLVWLAADLLLPSA